MRNKFLTTKLAAKFGLVSLLLAIPLASHGVTLTTYRIYLDDNNRSESFIVFTRDVVPEDCSLSLKHFDFDATGKMSLYKGAELPAYSAEEWVRFSPKNFVIQPGKPQTIRFSMRRKPNTEAQEYRSYVSVSCEDIVSEVAVKDSNAPKDRPTVSVKPKLVQNVPLIIRTGPLEVDASFGDIKLQGDLVRGKILRSGTRSLYGRISLVDKTSGEEIAFNDSISIYPETLEHSFEISASNDKNIALEQLALKFEEDEQYGGSLQFQKNLK
ncbi:hypothetical protein [Paraglaciecola hydrolytica]|uniref:Uncharacterized protein n=1 Tax=Paraglaciecola hydrolytica TaxID=1799789 RepID=A0A148KN44_9ALTE|nr:hypothetical protein [Paraglaciecola hydrolytica]KXI27658.1 hypothetical protein AX660_19060 [Paraglaciecola hydrolytica]